MSSFAVEHPFLIVRSEEYQALRERAGRSPWKEMAAEARARYPKKKFNPESHLGTKGYQMRDILGMCALLYVLDPDNAGAYRARALDTIRRWPGMLQEIADWWKAGKKGWYATVPPSSAYFQSVIMLDVMHDDLSAGELREVESILSDVAEWFWGGNRGWEMATTGPRALWAVYGNDTGRRDEAIRQYREDVMKNLTPEGVFRAGAEYANGRLGGERTAKFGVMHVLEYTGLDRSYYTNPSLRGFYEWLYAVGCAPNGSCVTFGDSGHGRSFETFYPLSSAWAAGNFSQLAARYAARRVAIAHPPAPSDLLSYCIAREPLPEPLTPVSRVWKDGMALFHEKNDTTDALMGALWNMTLKGSHQHRDTNAIYIAGYGDALLLNSGYRGYGTGNLGFTWEYVSDAAESSNVLTIDGGNHASKNGDGIVQSLLSGFADCASGLNDKALSGAARHVRTFCFVHPQDGRPGWFVAFDAVDRAAGAKEVDLMFHPASATVRAPQEGREYEWTIRLRQARDTFLNVFLGSEPARRPELRDGLLAGWDKDFVGKYLRASFPVAADGTARLCTVLFPHDAAHPKPVMTRLAGVSGARLDHGGGVVDLAVCVSSDAPVNVEGLAFCGEFVVARQMAGAGGFYLAGGATRLDVGDGAHTGFEASAPVTIAVREGGGRVFCVGATHLTLRGAGGEKRLSLEPGEHAISLN